MSGNRWSSPARSCSTAMIMRMLFGRILAPALLAVLAACGGGEGDRPRAAPEQLLSPDVAKFPIPRQIVVNLAPYATVAEALHDERSIDWIREPAKARAITLAYASQELRHHLSLIGVDASVRPGTSAPDASSIVLVARDDIAAADSLPVAVRTIDTAILGEEGYAITPLGSTLFVTAGNRLGVLNGTYRLLESIGFAWYDATDTHVPVAVTAATPIAWRQVLELPRVDHRGFWIYGDQPVPEAFAVWLRRNRFNIGGRPESHVQRRLGIRGWAGDHSLLQEEFSRPGLFDQHPEWFSVINGVRRPVAESGDYFNPAFGNAGAARFFADRMIERLESGDLRSVDVLNVWPADSRGSLFDQSPAAVALGNETDNLLAFYANVGQRFRDAFDAGQLSRRVTIAGISYFLTMKPPSNPAVVARLRALDYLHIFYLIERDWSGRLDAAQAGTLNTRILQSLAAWKAAGDLEYGVVEYHNLSTYSGVGLTDDRHFEANLSTLLSGRDALYASMHPLLTNPGPRRLTVALMSRLAWQGRGAGSDGTPGADAIIQQYFSRRYADKAAEWQAVHRLMADSVDNAGQLFGSNSLYWVLFQDYFWSPAPYTAAEAASFIPLYREGGSRELPGAFPDSIVFRETFRGLDESVNIQEEATRRWTAVLAATPPGKARIHMQEDVQWFEATASRYRLMAATADYLVARQGQLDLTEPRTRIAREIDFLQNSPVTRDTVSPVDQRAFIDLHRRVAGITASGVTAASP